MKSTPIVEFMLSGNSDEPNLRIMLDFPTLVSPTTTILNLKSLSKDYVPDSLIFLRIMSEEL